MKVFGYVRVSTETQSQTGYGIQSQVEAIRSYCKQHKLELMKIFRDEGVSGTIIERDGLNDLMSSFNGVNMVVVLNTSRLWRSDTVKVLIKRQFEKMNADIISIEQPTYSIHTKDPNDFLINGMMELLDQYERMSINLKLARGRKQKAKAGHKGGGNAPIGYKWQHDNVTHPIVILDPPGAAMVKNIFNQFIQTGSLTRVKKYCDLQGYRSQRGNELTPQAIQKILTNPFYKGDVTHGDMVTKGKHEAIIPASTFKKAQSLFKRKQHAPAPMNQEQTNP